MMMVPPILILERFRLQQDRLESLDLYFQVHVQIPEKPSNIVNSISQKQKIKSEHLFKNRTKACFLHIPVIHLNKYVFRTLSNIYDGAFRENCYQLSLLIPLKTSENQRFSNVFRGVKREIRLLFSQIR